MTFSKTFDQVLKLFTGKPVGGSLLCRVQYPITRRFDFSALSRVIDAFRLRSLRSGYTHVEQKLYIEIACMVFVPIVLEKIVRKLATRYSYLSVFLSFFPYSPALPRVFAERLKDLLRYRTKQAPVTTEMSHKKY